jgi:hypothetical protein
VDAPITDHYSPTQFGLGPAGPAMHAADNSHKKLGVQLQHLGIILPP